MELSALSNLPVVLLFVVCLQSTIAQIDLLGGNPLLTGATSFTFVILTKTVTKPTPCYVTSGDVSQCRRKRGLEEKPQIIQFDDSQIAPSEVLGLEAKSPPRSLRSRYNAERIFSSFDNNYYRDNYFNSLNIFRQLAANGRNNIITVGDCGKSTVNFSQFLSCLGLTVQETTTLTATFTDTMTISAGFTTLTVGGCTPSGFPYVRCPVNDILTATFNNTAIDVSSKNSIPALPSTTVPAIDPTTVSSPVKKV